MTQKRTKTAARQVEVTTLKPRLAKQVLELLLARHPELHAEVSELATSANENPDEFMLADEIEELMTSLDEGDIFKRAGRRNGRYTEQAEAEAEALTEAMEPYFDQLEQTINSGNDKAALGICKAIVLAMYRFSKNDDHPLLENLEDYPEETADWAVRLWRASGDVNKASDRTSDLERQFPSDFARRYTPDWAEWLIEED